MELPQLDITAFNADVRTWDLASLAKLRASISGLGVVRTGLLLRTLKSKLRKDRDGQVKIISYEFPRYAVYVEKGARKGYGGKKGSRWRGADGRIRKTNQKSLGKMNTGRSPARAWFNPVMTSRMGDLADIIVKHKGDMALNSILIT